MSHKKRDKTLKIRHMWLIKPITHIKESNKLYSRKKEKQKEEKYE